MRSLIFLSLIAVLRSTVAKPQPGDGDDVNLFLDQDADPLLPDDSTGLLPDNYADPTLDQASSADTNSNTPDWSDSIELAGVDDFCAADEEVQLIGRMRARDRASSSCKSSPGQNVNLLSLPNIFEVFKKVRPSTEPD